MSGTNDVTADQNGDTPPEGWILYDEDCGVCQAWVNFVRGTLSRRGFAFLPLQTPWVRERLAMGEEKLLEEMRILTPSGAVYGGGGAMIHLARRVWWWLPFYVASFLPGARWVIRAAYQWFASHRYWFSAKCGLKAKRGRHAGVSPSPEKPAKN